MAMTCTNISQHLLFPDLLHNLLEDCDRNDESNIISWSSKGNSFKVHNKEVFTHEILPRYFRQSKYKSFARQLNIWGFLCVTNGCDKGHYYHSHFLRGQREITCLMKRARTKKATQSTNEVRTSEWRNSTFLTPSPPRFDDTSAGGIPSTPSRSRNPPTLDAENYESVVFDFDDDHTCLPQQEHCFAIPALTVSLGLPKNKDHRVIRKFLEDAHDPTTPSSGRHRGSSSPPRPSSREEESVSQEKRGVKLLALPSLNLADKSRGPEDCGAIFSIDNDEPMEDWLSCLEKLFEAPCQHRKQHEGRKGQSCDLMLFQTNAKNCHKNCPDKASWSTWEFLEPRPLRINGGW